MKRSSVVVVRPPGASNDAGSRGGFTLVEFVVLIIIVVLLIGILLPSMGRSCVSSWQLRDSTQVRGVLQGMVIWSQNNNDRYPLPSDVDVRDATVRDWRRAKDTTGNIFSLLIYNGFVPSEMFVSPNEANALIEEYRDYEFSCPQAARDPANALWDPAFHGAPCNADNIGTKANPAAIGNNSYAHLSPVAAREPLWAATFVATEASIGNRGPRVHQVDKLRRMRVEPVFDASSASLLLHGSRTEWVGNVGYNDNHVTFETRMAPDGLTYTDRFGDRWADTLFFDEPDDPTGTNACLGVWTRAGPYEEDYVAWHD